MNSHEADGRRREGAKLSGKVALVTGGGQGIGLGIATEFAREGAAIAVLDVNESTGAQAAQALSAEGITARSYRANVADSSEVDEAIRAALADFGSIDILVNNAGISGVGSPTHEVDDDLWARSIGVMQSGIFYCSRAVARDMIAKGRGGVIIHISSIRGYSPNPGRLAYCATKSAAIMMAKVMAAEWGRYGIRVNAVAPGVQKTELWDIDVKRGVLDEDAYLRVIPLGRIGQPREVGRLCAFLASDDAAYITGSSITIDGGLTTIPSG